MQTQNTNPKLFGVVINKSNSHYTVHHNGQKTVCGLSTKLWKDLMDPPRWKQRRHQRDKQPAKSAVDCNRRSGDLCPTNNEEGTIVSISPRKNYLVRRSARPMPSAHAFEQVIAANIDQVVPIFAAAQPTPKWGMLDRYLVAAESCQIPSTILITKVDLVKG
jgi:ribosome biogenesis GTPase / thiamine phosphate phosphatase